MMRGMVFAVVIVSASAAVAAEDLEAEKRRIPAVLVECAVIYEEMARFHNPDADEENFARARALSARFMDEAARAAAAEGEAAPRAFVAEWLDRHRPKWNGRLRLFRQREANRQWIEFCDGLGRSRGLPPLTPAAEGKGLNE